MIKKTKIVAALMLGGVVAANAAPKHQMYISSKMDDLNSYYDRWEPGQPYPGSVNGSSTSKNDEQFFISRVKPKKRFTFSGTQVDPNLTHERKVMWFCPIGEQNWTSIPAYSMDMEPFSMWSYLDIYSNWTQNFLRQPGAFADVCHKNGVSGGVCILPAWAATVSRSTRPELWAIMGRPTSSGTEYWDSNWNWVTPPAIPTDAAAEKLLKIMKYYGIDGLGFNSEGDWSDVVGLKYMFANMHRLKSQCEMDNLQFSWYDGEANDGTQAFTYTVNANNCDWFANDANKGGEAYPAANGFFLNYNSGSSGKQYIEGKGWQGKNGITYWDAYYGLNMQAGGVSTSESGGNKWSTAFNELSIGVWGAHNKNMLWESAGEKGSDPITKQQTYLTKCERVFTGGKQNPVMSRHSTYNVSGTSVGVDALQNFHGFSKLITARSTLSWKENGYEPFITRFNLGIGKFFNNEGKTTFNKEWYNIGMQDYLPTWRWWITKDFMGRDSNQVPAGVTAGFTYEDAWFGGSCLKVSNTGTENKFYLQLFKTQFNLAENPNCELKIRYKVLKGSGKMSWAVSTEDAPSTEVNTQIEASLTQGDWKEKTVAIGGRGLQVQNKTIALLGLKFENVAPGTEILIGEISLMKASETITPAWPSINGLPNVLQVRHNEVDFKLNWTCEAKEGKRTNTEAWMPVYNSDCDIWYYEIYSKQKGGQEVLCTTTTSWAAYVVGAPFDRNGTRTMQFGVRAVGLDGKPAGAIVWSGDISLGSITNIEGIEVDKPVIKANEEFTISLVDPTHSDVVFTIVDASTGTTVATSSSATTFTTSLDKEGTYNVKYGNQEFKGAIQITPATTGAMPRIDSLEATEYSLEIGEGQSEVSTQLTYKSRKADGSVSQALKLRDVNALAINGQPLTSYPVYFAFWIKLNSFDETSSATSLINKRKTDDPWSMNGWGDIWTDIQPDMGVRFAVRGSESPHLEKYYTNTNEGGKGVTIAKDQWFHIVYGINSDRHTINVWINGKLAFNYYYSSIAINLTANRLLYFGGISAKGQRSGFDGLLDDFQMWTKDLTDQDALDIMNGKYSQENAEIPEELKIYYNFEESTFNRSNYSFKNLGKGGESHNGTFVTFVDKQGSTIEGAQTAQNVSFAEVEAGVPSLPGETKIETKAKWEVISGDASAANFEGDSKSDEGESTNGSTTAKFTKDGSYKVRLTLTNAWGSATKELDQDIVVVKNEPATGLGEQEVADLSVYPNPFVDKVLAAFNEAGTYQVLIYSMDGKLVSARNMLDVTAGELVSLDVNGAAGTYLVKILNENNKLLKTVTLIKK